MQAQSIAVFNNWRLISARSLYIRVGLQRMQLRRERALVIDVILEWSAPLPEDDATVFTGKDVREGL
eukprot:548322-Rhodomonas_salina.3